MLTPTIGFDPKSFYKLIDELTVRIIKNVERNYKEKVWIDEKQAKTLLGISERSTLQKLRDSFKIEFSKFGRIIRYHRPSILNCSKYQYLGLVSGF